MNKTIFFIWVQDVNTIPQKLLENIDYITNQNLDYNVKIYDSNLFKIFLEDKPKYLLENFNKLNNKCYALLADYMRIVLL